MEQSEKYSVLPFSLPRTMLIVGATQSGKTQFIKRLLLEREAMFTPVPDRIIYCYTVWQEAYDELERILGEKIEFRTDVPPKEELIEIWNKKGGETLVVIDDKMSLLKNNSFGQSVVELVTVVCHHCHVTCLIVTHHLFHNKILGEIGLNSQSICLFRNNRSAMQIKSLASQMMPGQTDYLMDSYEKATGKNYGYLIIDTSHNEDKKFRLRTAIFPNENTVVFTSRK